MMDQASLRQHTASTPSRSTWLSANAGSGKTKVLTDRVARLLLSGTRPEHILCLTFTKAAASEMQNRLFDRLGAWAMTSKEALRRELETLEPEHNFTDDDLARARTLFATAVETPGGLKIQTIHSFCSSLLRRFPLEAGVPPQFVELDEEKSQLIIADILERMCDSDEQPIFDALADHITDLDAGDLAQNLVRMRQKFDARISRSEVYAWFDLADDTSVQSILSDVFLGSEQDIFASAADVMATSEKTTDHTNAALFKAWSTQEPSEDLLHQCFAKLLTGAGAKQPFSSKFGASSSSLPTKAIFETHGDALKGLGDLMSRVEVARPKLLSLYDAQRAWALQNFAAHFLPQYAREKDRRGLLDFDDMIAKARDLLSISSVADWVLFRLDGGIDHILVDEAQDTSPDQWKVVEFLAGEFTSGEGARTDVKRTIFVVGDQKQSIYSFQGAAPDEFQRMKHYFAERLALIQEPLQDLSLEHSFRSSPAILRATDAVFDASNQHGLKQDANHIAYFDEAPGRVDLWPLLEPNPAEKAEERWEEPIDRVSEEHHSILLANKLADRIAQMLQTGSIPRKGDLATAIEPRDILILVRKRSGLFGPLLNALKSHPSNIPVAGADRLKLHDELAVKDIMSLLSFLALPDDDLALAEALRSPLFGWSEKDLYELAHKRTAVTLWRELFARKNDWPETFAMLDALRSEADFRRPYELIESVLTTHFGRTKILARLGREAEDGIDALLSEAQNYERDEVPSLTGFITWFQLRDVDVKRAFDEHANVVRIMTVHGSKGLEAPIIILPDTIRQKKETGDELIDLGDGRICWKSTKARRSLVLADRMSQMMAKDVEEDRRLLYVAMTRAEKWLIVAGAGKPNVEDSWYGLVSDGMDMLDTHQLEDGTRRYQVGDWPAREDADTRDPSKLNVPDWARRPAPAVTSENAILSPSSFEGSSRKSSAPSERDAEGALRFGRQLHLLLEVFADHPSTLTEERAQQMLSQSEDGILEGELTPLMTEAKSVFNASYDWPVFASGLAEVSFTSRWRETLVHGVIDRVIVDDNTVKIIDYKTNAVPPTKPEDVSEGYLAQLGLYAHAVGEMFPDHAIEIAILWTRSATLMQLSPEDAYAALDKLTAP